MISTIFRTLANIDLRYLVIGVLLIIIFLQRACTEDCEVQTVTNTVVKTDTIYKTNTVIVDRVVPGKPAKPPKPQKPLTPSDNIDTCKARFNTLLKEHTKLTIYTDTIKLIDNIGTITVVDSVWMNKLLTRRIINDYKIPIITNTETITITKEKEPRNQFYIGGNLYGNSEGLEIATPGLLLKTKKDNIYQLNAGINFGGGISYGLGYYWKIKLKKE